MIADNIVEPVSRLFKLLNDPNRLRIILAIGKGDKTVSEIMQATNLPQTLVSFHLRPLRESGMLSAERRGPFVYNRVTEPRLIDLLASLAGVALKDDEKPDTEFPVPPMRFMRRWMKGGE
ncbi:MAG: ArsR/SmtB family transcription factor [Syntrophales bacterium]